MKVVLVSIAGLALSLLSEARTGAQGATCEPSWVPTFGAPGLDDVVYALTAFDDGNGPALYVGGSFRRAGPVGVSHIARWDGTSWSALGSGVGEGTSQSVLALAAFDDGSGPALYAGGSFGTAGGAPANRIARWDGASWSPLGTGVSGSSEQVSALAVFDDGSGSALYVGGSFTNAGGVSAN